MLLFTPQRALPYLKDLLRTCWLLATVRSKTSMSATARLHHWFEPLCGQAHCLPPAPISLRPLQDQRLGAVPGSTTSHQRDSMPCNYAKASNSQHIHPKVEKGGPLLPATVRDRNHDHSHNQTESLVWSPEARPTFSHLPQSAQGHCKTKGWGQCQVLPSHQRDSMPCNYAKASDSKCHLLPACSLHNTSCRDVLC